jgi:glycosyltransferase involved in cell wall biosynthesis
MSKPWRIGLVMEGDSNWMGGVEYIKNIVFAIQTLPPETKNLVEICLICDESLPTELYDSIRPYLKDVFYVAAINTSLLEKIFWKISKLLLSLKDYNPRLSRFLKNNPDHNIDFLYPCFTNSKQIIGLSSAAWITDFQHKYLPQLFTIKEINIRDKIFANFAKYSSMIVVSSQSAKSDFSHFFPDSEAIVQVLSFTTFPIPEWFSVKSEEIRNLYPIPERFFLVSNQFWQHKNYEAVFNAVAILQKRGIYINVVCTGKLYDPRNPKYIEELNTMIKYLNISERVHILGLIPKEHQVQLIRYCIAMIQPSLFEGWSTVVEDARCFGKHIVLSNIPVHLEQDPPNALFFEKDDVQQLATILEECWKNTLMGFNQSDEEIALQANHRRIQDFGYEFLRIAKVEV